MKFDRVNDCKDKAYTLNFQVTKCDVGNVQIFYTPGTDKGKHSYMQEHRLMESELCVH